MNVALREREREIVWKLNTFLSIDNVVRISREKRLIKLIKATKFEAININI